MLSVLVIHPFSSRHLLVLNPSSVRSHTLIGPFPYPTTPYNILVYYSVILDL